MPSRSRSTLVGAICCLLGVLALPNLALAHGAGRYRGAGGGRHASRVQLVCAEAGVPLNGQAYGEAHGLSALSESQLKELKTACEALAAVSATQRKADEAAAKTLHEALQAARTKLDEACPTLAEHHWPGGWGELSSTCKEALKTAANAAHEAQKAFGKALEEAAKPFQAALSEFETKVKSILEALEAAGGQYPHGGGWGGLPGFRGGPAGRPFFR